MNIRWAPEWALEFWRDDSTACFYVKFCRSIDGRFVVDADKKVLPLFGFRREHHENKLDEDTLKPRTRIITGWRLWMPYLMLWYIRAEHDLVVITLPGDDDTIH